VQFSCKSIPEISWVGDYRRLTMLFMNIFRWEPGKTDEIMQARMKESIPSGVKVIKEWVALETNIVFRLVDTNDPVALAKVTVTWADLGYNELHPVMPSEDILLLKK
jgi:hypothetical protein